MNISIMYNAITIFAISCTALCIELPLPMGPRREQEFLAFTNHSSNSNVSSSVESTNVENEHYPGRLLMKNDAEDYFDPDKILYSPNDRRTGNFEIAKSNNTYISYEEAAIIARPRYPIEPIKNNSFVLPHPKFHPKLVQHVLHKNLWPVDLVSRKIFIRGNETKSKIVPAIV